MVATFQLIVAWDCIYANDHAEAKSIRVSVDMKPPPFDYARASSVEEAVGLLAKHGDDAKIRGAAREAQRARASIGARPRVGRPPEACADAGVGSAEEGCAPSAAERIIFFMS